MTLRKSYAQDLLFGTAALWCLCNGIMHVITPLYALYLGFSILEISSIVAVPVLATLVVRFVGGALSDRFGERGVLQGCYLLQTIASLILIGAAGYISLIVVLIVANVSRSTFWIPAQSLASQLAGSNVGKNLGRLSAANYAGTLLGQILGGVMVAYLGYHPSFLILSALGVACTLLSLALPPSEAKPKGRTVWQITQGVGRFLRYPQTWLIISGSGAAALPQAMCASIYPLYLAYLNYGEEWIGLAVSLRAAGPIAIGLLIAVLITPARQEPTYAVGMVLLGIGLIGSGIWHQYFLVSLCIIALGAGGGVMDLLYQVQASALSHASNRSMAMASTGMGWNISPFFMPLIVGWLVEMWGFEFALVATGCFMLLVGAGTRLWFQLCALDERALREFVSKESDPV
ncbi:MAG TPA: MFS transporter [Candidatus Binatia bacterium]|nr:MFS transporter [Candidatus Binatia bacterium]